mgnify:CR=1 FL=1
MLRNYYLHLIKILAIEKSIDNSQPNDSTTTG